MGHYRTLLAAIVAAPHQPTSAIPLLTAAEQRQLIVEWNDTRKEYRQDLCLHQWFERQVEKTPSAVALAFEDERLTYRQLDDRANQLANYLRGLGVGPEAPVGICMERSLEMVVGLMGILKAGAAYVPLDPGYPEDRPPSFMLADADVSVLLTQFAGRFADRLPKCEAAVVRVNTDWPLIGQSSEATASTGITTDNLAYMVSILQDPPGGPKAQWLPTAGSVTRLCGCRKPTS